MYTGSFLRLGERSYNLERLFNLREGLTAEDDALPDRLTKTPQPEPGNMTAPRSDSVSTGNTKVNNANYVVPLEKMLKRYYKVRGWNKEGIPSGRKLRRLKIEK